MRWKQTEDEPKVFALVFETGDEMASVLQRFSKNQGLVGSSFKAIGALSYAKLGWFNWETKKYDPACVLDEQLELLSQRRGRCSSGSSDPTRTRGLLRHWQAFWQVPSAVRRRLPEMNQPSQAVFAGLFKLIN
jgi:hypothetical protein